MRLSFEVSGDKLIERELLRVGSYAGDATPAFVAIGDLLIRETRDQFATEGRHASGGWPQLAKSTVAAKARAGFRPLILQRTGTLMATLTGDRYTPGMVFEPRSDELIYGTRVPYAGYHQTGTARMPRRRPLEFTEQTKRAAVKILQRYILTGELAR